MQSKSCAFNEPFLELRQNVIYSGKVCTKLVQFIYDYNSIENLNSGQIW